MRKTTEALWNEFHDGLRGFVLKRVADPEEAEDILQEVFLRVHARLGTVRDEDRVAAWLFRIARNTIVDRYRRRPPPLPLPEDAAAAAPEEEPSVEARRRIEAALDCLLLNLPVKYREAVRLFEIEGLKQQEIAERLGLRLSGAKSRVRRGRQMLRRDLLDCCRLELDRRGRIVDYSPRRERNPGCAPP